MPWPGQPCFLVLAYLISTIFSVSQVVSLWGSYQRLQGTYSTFSYIVIFALLCGTMRRREQVERLITIMLFTSLPASLYGLVQHNKLEFLPWAGDVTTRVTSSMGNAIFIAAWLVMVVPLSLARFVDAATPALDRPAARPRSARTSLSPVRPGLRWPPCRAWRSMCVFIPAPALLRRQPEDGRGGRLAGRGPPRARPWRHHPALLPGDTRPPGLGAQRRRLPVPLMVQLTTIWFSGSRGPLLGLMAGLFVFAIMFTVLRRLRRTFYAAIGLALAGAVFLGVFNLPNTPLEPLKQIPYVGRLGSFLETESGTGKVRVLIWEGAIQLIKAEPVRTLIGWGPESMYVAYNRFYPPDLAHYEARNASPDRSHNETYDSLVITGVLGFLAYWTVFYTFFYFALNLLGLVRANHRRWLYGALLATGIVAFALLYAEVLPLPASPIFPLLGVAVLGVYLVFFVGDFFKTPPPSRRLGIYQTLHPGHLRRRPGPLRGDPVRHRHRLHAHLLLALSGPHRGHRHAHGAGDGTPRPTESALPATAAGAARRQPRPRRRRLMRNARSAGPGRHGGRARRRPGCRGRPSWPAGDWWPVVTYAMLAAVVLVTMIYDFVVPQPQGTPAIVLALIFGHLALHLPGDSPVACASQPASVERILRSFLVCSLVTWTVVVIFSLLHPVRFASPTTNLDPSQFISYFYVWIGVLVLALACRSVLQREETPLARRGRVSSSAGPIRSWWGWPSSSSSRRT